LLHDEKANTSERVAWTQTLNLATNNPHTAVNVMCAVSMDAPRLKQEAGVATQGRKSNKHVGHITLAWDQEEKKELTADEQMRAAKWVLREMGADKHQVLVVAHNDKKQPHIHLMVNRVSTDNGKLLDISYSHLKMSKFAQKYEQERGKIFCHQRVINNAARKRGEYVRAKKDMPRHIFEAAKQVANDNSKKKALLDQHRKKAAAIAKKDREDKARHKIEFAKLQQDRKAQLVKLKEQMKASIDKQKQTVRDVYRPRWEKQHFDQQHKLAGFEKNEKTIKGRMKNALELVQWRNLMGRKPGEKTTLSKAFRILSNEGARKEALQRQFKRQEQALKKEQDTKIKSAAAAAKLAGEKKTTASRPLFERERNGLILKHRLERAKTKTEWKAHDQKQREAWQELKKEAPANSQSAYQRDVINRANRSKTPEQTKSKYRDRNDDRDR